MIENVATSLREYYEEKYGKPNGDKETLDVLCNIFKDLMQYNFITSEVREGVSEYYRLIQNRGLPAYEWILEAFHVVSKKNVEKRNFPYVIGMLRGWLKFGFGHMPSQEEVEIVDYFQEVTGTEVSYETRQMLQNMMGRYGVIRMTRMISSLSNEWENVDLSKIRAEQLSELLADKYSEK